MNDPPFNPEDETILIAAYVDLGGERVLLNAELDAIFWDEVTTEANMDASVSYSAATLRKTFNKMGEKDNNFGRGWENDGRAAAPATEDGEDEMDTEMHAGEDPKPEEELVLHKAGNPDREPSPCDELIQRMATMSTDEESPSIEELLQRMKIHRREEGFIALVLRHDESKASKERLKLPSFTKRWRLFTSRDRRLSTTLAFSSQCDIPACCFDCSCREGQVDEGAIQNGDWVFTVYRGYSIPVVER